MKILVTGASGFIGRHLVEKLCQQKHQVRCLVRKNSNVGFLKDNKVELVYGDITIKETLGNIAEGIELVFHLVGIGNICAVSKEAYNYYYKVNVLGTKNLLEECRRAGIKKFVYFSSVAAMGLLKDSHEINESMVPHPVTPYERSKFESEKINLEYCQRYSLPSVIIRPTMVYGQGAIASEILHICKFMRKYRIFPTIGSGDNLMSLVHVYDLVDAAYLAAIQGKPSQVYIITDKSYTLNQLSDIIAKELDIRIFKIRLPVKIAYCAAFVIETFSQAIKIDPFFTRQRVKSVLTDRIFSINKAATELGYTPKINLEKGIKDTIYWYKNNGYLP